MAAMSDGKLTARVKDGRLLLDEPTDLPDGTEVELEAVPALDLTPQERARLDAAIEQGLAEADRGEGIPAEEVIRQLRARE